jgi:hypothetical protein
LYVSSDITEKRDISRKSYVDDNAEPAWMNDTAPDPAIAGSSGDPLIQFVPGEDMIAAHRVAKETAGWRGDKPRVSFFGSEVSDPLPPPKPKVFNSADYLLPSKGAEETEPAASGSAFQSRFQRFFGSPSATDLPRDASRPPSHSPAQPMPSPTPPVPHDDHMAKLMGMLVRLLGIPC